MSIKPFEDRELNITIEIALYRHKVERQLRESEAQLRAHQDELEARVAERTAELDPCLNEQLRLEIAARERAQAERAAAQDDRRRLAQDIHDSVTQSIFSLIFTTQAARAAAQHGAGGAGRRDAGRGRRALPGRHSRTCACCSTNCVRRCSTTAAWPPRCATGSMPWSCGPACRRRLIAPRRPCRCHRGRRRRVPGRDGGTQQLAQTRACDRGCVELRTEGNELILTVADNGIGFDRADDGRAAPAWGSWACRNAPRAWVARRPGRSERAHGRHDGDSAD